MKLHEAAHLPGFARVIRLVVSGQPELAEPYVQKKHCEKAGQIEDILFDGNGPAERRSADAQGRSNVGIAEKPLCKNEVEQEA